jgi:hypothetical protein
MDYLRISVFRIISHSCPQLSATIADLSPPEIRCLRCCRDRVGIFRRNHLASVPAVGDLADLNEHLFGIEPPCSEGRMFRDRVKR